MKLFGDHVVSTIRNVFVDRSIREQTDKVQSTFSEDGSNVNDPCKNVFPEGVSCCPCDLVTLGSSLFDDVGVHDMLFEKINHTSTQGGKACLRALIDHPISDSAILEKRQHVIKCVEKVMLSDDAKVREALAVMKETESDVAWALQHPMQDEEIRDLYSMAFFKIWPLRRLNECPMALTALNVHRIVVSPLVGLFSPLVYFVIPYLVLRYRVGFKCSIFQYLKMLHKSMSVASSVSSPSMQWAKYASLGFSLLFYFQGVFSSIELARTVSSVCSSICKHSLQIEKFNDSASKLIASFNNLRSLVSVAFFPQTRDFEEIQHTSDDSRRMSDKQLFMHNFGKGLSNF